MSIGMTFTPMIKQFLNLKIFKTRAFKLKRLVDQSILNDFIIETGNEDDCHNQKDGNMVLSVDYDNHRLNVPSQLPSTITKSIIDFVLYCDNRIINNNNNDSNKSLIENALNLSKVCKRWLKITSIRSTSIPYIKRLQQNIESSFCLLYHYPLPKVELVFGYDYEQISYNTMKHIVLLNIQSTRQNNNQNQPSTLITYQQLYKQRNTEWSQFSNLKHQIEHQPASTLLKPLQPKVIQYINDNEMRQPPQHLETKTQLEDRLRILYNGDQEDPLSIYRDIKENELKLYSNMISKQSAIFNQLVQLFTNRAVFGEITILHIYTYDDIDVDVLIPIINYGNQLTTLFLDGLHNQKVCQAILPIAMNLTTLAYRDTINSNLDNINYNKKKYNNNNTLERLYLVTTNISILNNIFISGGGLIFKNLKFLQIPSCDQLHMPWNDFKVSLPLLEVLNMEGPFSNPCPALIDYLIARGGEVQYMALVHLCLETFPLFQYLPYYLDLKIDMTGTSLPPIKYHTSLLGLSFFYIPIGRLGTKDELLKLDPFQNIPFETLKSLKLAIDNLEAITPYLDRFKQLDTLTLVIYYSSGTLTESLCQSIAQIQTLTSLELFVGNGHWNENFTPMIKQLVNLKIFKTGTSNLSDNQWISNHFNIQIENQHETTLTRK
ncbi:hypothetical protein DFA_06539 [Cavenderia fasciculata]|uniref:F-box domain-containing protein n=1 Tax=Cavenderia fasciculata TaxID=261658 RepID=F4PJA3_CACFS|nr:uncharacterized protein DFA_06539 [Cavenderia fasciculata]EGG24389.1 hypothetical protein DFA_06539 [Cavenderia fasciculata]|eukprot:XP_004362240.1 hypothetical protein DFA_06539 [Cavenderia fasciculata]